MTLKPRALRAWLPEPPQTPADFPQRTEEVARTNTALKLAPKLNLIKPQCFFEVRKNSWLSVFRTISICLLSPS